jgi:hypothetical protein
MFTFKLKNGETHEFPRFSECGAGSIRKTRKIEDETDRVFSMIEEGFGEDSDHIQALDLVENSTLPEFIREFMGGLDQKK